MAAPKGNRYSVESRGKSALQRFAEKCQFDPVTGCVLWCGGTTSGQGNSARYGAFWDDGRRVPAHRWAAVNIHGIELGSDEAGHCCPHGPNSLCVQHLTGQTKSENVAERNTRVAKANQTAATRQFYLFKQLGILEPEPETAAPADVPVIPYYEPPEWFRPFIKVNDNDECPF
jgi:hypothetical protein